MSGRNPTIWSITTASPGISMNMCLSEARVGHQHLTTLIWNVGIFTNWSHAHSWVFWLSTGCSILLWLCRMTHWGFQLHYYPPDDAFLVLPIYCGPVLSSQLLLFSFHIFPFSLSPMSVGLTNPRIWGFLLNIFLWMSFWTSKFQNVNASLP